MIEVVLQGQNINFDPCSIEWFKKRDFYSSFTLKGLKCFVKKYIGKKPAAWELLISLIGQEGTNMPMIYNAIYDRKSNTYYVFFEFIRGVTLKEYILNGDILNPKTILNQIDTALFCIHSKGFWFSDFNEENIFITSGLSKKILLIDVDSCWKKSIRPSHISDEEGGIPGAAQNIGRHVLEFYSKYLKISQGITYNDIPGTNLNYLQLLVLCVKLNIFQNRKKIDQAFQYIRPESFRDLQKIIYDCDPSYSKGVFTLAKDNSRDMRAPVKQLITRILNR